MDLSKGRHWVPMDIELFAQRHKLKLWRAFDLGPDLAQATWEWPPKSIGPGYAITVLQRWDERQVRWLGGYDFEGGYLTP